VLWAMSRRRCKTQQMEAEGPDEYSKKEPFVNGWMIVVMVGIVALAAVGIAALVTRNSTDSSSRATTKVPAVPTTETSTAAGTPTSTVPPSETTPSSTIGTTVDISDNAGNKVAVTLEQIVDPDTPDAGASGECSPDQLVAVQLSITNLGTSIVSTSAVDRGVILVDSNSAPWQNHTEFGCGIASSMVATSTCASSSSTLDLAPGATGIACPAINVPAGDRIAQVQFQAGLVFPPAFSTGPTVATWQVG